MTFFSFYLGHSVVTLVAFLLPHTSQAHTLFSSGPFYLLFSQPGMPFLQVVKVLMLSFLSCLCSCVTLESSSLPHLCRTAAVHVLSCTPAPCLPYVRSEALRPISLLALLYFPLWHLTSLMLSFRFAVWISYQKVNATEAGVTVFVHCLLKR